jgi:hypothetical protein
MEKCKNRMSGIIISFIAGVVVTIIVEAIIIYWAIGRGEKKAKEQDEDDKFVN